MRRSRVIYLIVAVVVIVLGISSRSYSDRLPVFLASYAGDTLWALTAFLSIGILFPRWTTLRVCIAALVFAILIELSQLYHSSWIDQLRHTRLGGLILGYGFLWSDILCYCVGIGLGCLLEVLFYRTIKRQYHAKRLI
jgi:hypothetical protein